MKKIFALLIFCNITIIQYGQIIADHNIVDRFDDIPQTYIDKAKEMWVVAAGESHSAAYRTGLTLLESTYPAYAVSAIEYGTPEAYTTSNLRVSRGTWGDYSHSTGWIYTYGEEDWFTNATAIARTKAGITYCNTHSLNIAAIGFGWCWDMVYGDASTSIDPVYGCKWYGETMNGPEGDRYWGLNSDDYSITGNSVSMDTYLSTTQAYIDYCAANGYSTKVFFTTGPVDTYYSTGEAGYQGSVKHQYIRNYVMQDPIRILFDYADILCYDDNGVQTTATWNGHTFPRITSTNGSPEQTGHISNAGAVRLAKAMWWMLARMAGWDGGTTIPPGTWLGVTTDWSTGSNWYGGTVPTALTNVIIPLTTKQPVISTLQVASCNNLTINSGASFTINAGCALTVNGSLSNSGTLTILSAATDNSGSLIVKGSSTGIVTYNRFLRPENNAGDLHFFSSPVGGQSVSGFTTANNSKINFLDSKYQIWQWNEESLSDNWQIVTSGSFLSGEGYNVDQRTGSDGLLTFTGSVVNSTSFTATSPYIYGYTARNTIYDYGYDNPNPIWSGTRSWTNYGGGGWNLMGNPFTSAMEASKFITANAVKFDPYYQALYVYDGVSGVYQYAAAETPGYTGGGSYGNYVQAGQGFFILALYDGIVFNFNSTMQVHNANVNLLKSAAAEEPWPGLQLKVKYGSNENLTTIVYNNEMTAGLDPGYDVGQFSAGPAVEIYTSLVNQDNSVNFARQALPVIDCNKNIVAVGIDSEKGGEVTFSAYYVPLENYNFWLEDRQTGIFTALNSDTYTVTLPAKTYGTGRFFIYASTNMPTAIRPQPDDPSVRVWISDDKVIIKGSVSEKAICEIYDLRGQKVLMTHLTDGELNIVNVNSTSGGPYLVRIVDGLKVTAKKVMLL